MITDMLKYAHTQGELEMNKNRCSFQPFIWMGRRSTFNFSVSAYVH